MIKGPLPNNFDSTFEISCKRLFSTMPTVQKIEDTTFIAQIMGKITSQLGKKFTSKVEDTTALAQLMDELTSLMARSLHQILYRYI